MEITSSAFSSRAPSSMRPSGSVYLAALVSRLPMTCERRSGSASSRTFSAGRLTTACDAWHRAAAARSPPRRHHRFQIDVVLLELELPARDARYVEQIVEQQRHALHLARNDFAAPLALAVVGRVGVEDAHCIADRRQRIAQLMCQRGEELVLAAIGLEQRALGVLEPRDVEVDTGPALDPAAASRIGTPWARMAWYLPSAPIMRCSRYQRLPVRAHSRHASMVSSTSSGCSAEPQPSSIACSRVMPVSLRNESLR
jgi:hypothetical protein